MKAEEYYNSIADKYDNLFKRPIHLAEDAFLEQYLNRKRYLTRSILDIGCGTGLVAKWVKGFEECSYTGIDIAAKMIEEARNYPFGANCHFHQEDIEELPMYLCYFNNVISIFGSLNYPDLYKAMESIKETLEPGGKFFFMFYTPKSAKRALFVHNQEPEKTEKNFYTWAELKPYFKDFKITKVSGFNLYADKLKFSKRFLFWYLRIEHFLLGWLKNSGNYIIVEGVKPN